MEQKIIFLYDELMKKEVQDLLHLKLQFIGFAYTKGKLYFCNDTKKRRFFLIPKNTVNIVLGALYVINNWEFDKLKLCSFYNSSIAYTDKIMQEDLYKLEKIFVEPIKIKLDKLPNLDYVKYQEKIEVDCFVGNEINTKIKHSLSRGTYYKVKNFDKESFTKIVADLHSK